MCAAVYDPQGRPLRFFTAAGRLLVMREVRGGWAGYACAGCRGIACRRAGGVGAPALRGGVTEQDVVAFIGRHRAFHTAIAGAWDGPGRFVVHMSHTLERAEEGEAILDMYCRAGRAEWLRVTLALTRWPGPQGGGAG